MRALLVTLALISLPALAQTGRLNDTGQTNCYDASNAVVACATVAADVGARPRQDGRFGRDVAGMAKTGGGAAGFDFTALDASGAATSTGSHVCVKDNHTDLIWSTETITNVSWFAAAMATSTYNRCGFGSGWRVPTRRELLSIVHHGASSPAIDTTYFPGTVSDWYWTSDIYVPSTARAWGVYFYGGYLGAYSKTDTHQVRLVRSVNPPG